MKIQVPRIDHLTTPYEALLPKALGGDEAAYQELALRTYVLLYRFSYVAMGYMWYLRPTPHEQEDLIHHVYLHLFGKDRKGVKEGRLRTIREPRGYEGWLRVLAVHAAINRSRVLKPERAREQSLQEPVSTDGESLLREEVVSSPLDPTPDELAGLSEITSLLRRAFSEALADHPLDAIIVELRSRGYSHKEIAALLEMTPPVVTLRYFRAKKRIAERLAAFLGEDGPATPVAALREMERADPPSQQSRCPPLRLS